MRIGARLCCQGVSSHIFLFYIWNRIKTPFILLSSYAISDQEEFSALLAPPFSAVPSSCDLSLSEWH